MVGRFERGRVVGRGRGGSIAGLRMIVFTCHDCVSEFVKGFGIFHCF